MQGRMSRGLTAVELLAVIVTIGLLLAVLAPGCGLERDRGRRAQCLGNSHNVAIAFKNYEACTQSMPGWKNRLRAVRGDLAIPVSWVPPLFPFLDRTDLADLWEKGTPDEWLLSNPKLPVLICPSNPPEKDAAQALAYVVNCGKGTNTKACDGVFFDLTIISPAPPRVLPSDIPDGASHTLLLGESLYAGPWHPDGGKATAIYPYCSPDSPQTGGVGMIWVEGEGKVTDQLSSRHGGGAVVSFCDGSQQFLRDDIDYTVYQHLMTPDSAAAGIAGKLRAKDK